MRGLRYDAARGALACLASACLLVAPVQAAQTKGVNPKFLSGQNGSGWNQGKSFSSKFKTAADKGGDKASSSVGLDKHDTILFVWDSKVAGDFAATKKLVDFAKDSDVTALAVEASPIGYDEPGAWFRYVQLRAWAAANHIKLFALIGYPWFTVAPDAGLPGQPTSQLEAFDMVEHIAASNLFDGLVEDSQPYLVLYDENGTQKSYLWEQTQLACEGYLSYLKGLQARKGNLVLIKATPFWFDDYAPLAALKLHGATVAQSLAAYEAQHTDARLVMAYRDRAFGVGGVLDLVLGDLALGPVIVGLETGDQGTQLGYTTFFEEGVDVFKKEADRVRNTLWSDKRFGGMALHHYGSLQGWKF